MAAKDSRPRIVWFRDDLRISDHPALAAAAQGGAPVICLFVLDEASALQPPRARTPGGAARWWLAQSLRALEAGLAPPGTRLVVRKGAAPTVRAPLDPEAQGGHRV